MPWAFRFSAMTWEFVFFFVLISIVGQSWIFLSPKTNWFSENPLKLYKNLIYSTGQNYLYIAIIFLDNVFHTDSIRFNLSQLPLLHGLCSTVFRSQIPNKFPWSLMEFLLNSPPLSMRMDSCCIKIGSAVEYSARIIVSSLLLFLFLIFLSLLLCSSV